VSKRKGITDSLMDGQHGLYKKLSDLDNRTALAKSVTELKDYLIQWVQNPNPAAEILIQKIVYKTIRTSLYEASVLKKLNLGDDDFKESDHYLPMSNSLRLDLQMLAKMAGRSQEPDLGAYLAEKYGEHENEKTPNGN